MLPIEQFFLQVHSQSGHWTANVCAATGAVSPADLAEIADWFTASEDQLLLQCRPWNLFFHPLPSGHFALGIANAVRQHFFSFRKQPDTVNVQVLIIAPQTLLAFQNHPIVLFEMLRQQNHIPMISTPLTSPPPLSPLVPILPESLFNGQMLETLAKQPGAMSLAQLLQSLFQAECTFFTSNSASAFSVISALFDFLPIRYRPDLTFSTNLFFSLKNSFRLSGFSGLRQRAVRFVKHAGIPVLFLEQENKGSVETLDPWARFVYLLVQSRRFDFWKQYLNRDHQSALLSFEAAESQPVLWPNLHETGVVLSKALLSGALPNQEVAATDLPVRSLEELRCLAVVDQMIPMVPIPNTKKVKPKSPQRLAERCPRFRSELTALEAYLVRGIFGDETVLPKIKTLWLQLMPQLDREMKEMIQEEAVTTIHAVLMSFDGESSQRLRRSSQLLELMVFFLQGEGQQNLTP